MLKEQLNIKMNSSIYGDNKTINFTIIYLGSGLSRSAITKAIMVIAATHLLKSWKSTLSNVSAAE